MMQYDQSYSLDWVKGIQLKMPLKLFHATVANVDTGSLKSLHLIRIWTTCWRNLNQIVWSEMYKILRFLTKNRILKPFLSKRRRYFARRFCS